MLAAGMCLSRWSTTRAGGKGERCWRYREECGDARKAKADLANARAAHAEAMRSAAAQLGRARAGAELTAARLQHAKEQAE